MLIMQLLVVTVAVLFLITSTTAVFPKLRNLELFQLLRLSRAQWLLLCICFSVIFCAACNDTDTMFNIVIAALDGVGIVLSGLGALITPGEATLINGAIQAISGLVAAAKAAWDAYEADPSAEGAMAALEAAVASIQSDIPTILAGLKITNPTLQAWITTLVGLVGKLAADITADILPYLKSAAEAHAAGDSEPVKALGAKFKELTKAFVVGHNEALADSGLPADTIKDVQKHFNHVAEPHFGPLPI